MIKVLIVYSHDNGSHKENALNLSNRLRHDGIDCMIDQYVADPDEGWVKWMMNQIRNSDYILMICTENYYRKIIDPEKTSGANWEASLIYGELYNSNSISKKFKPILFNSNDKKWIPDVINQYTYYCIPEDFKKLYGELTNQPSITKPLLGKIKKLEAKSTGIPEKISEKELENSFMINSSLQPVKKSESLVSNLLEVRSFPDQFYSADTNIRSVKNLWKKLIELNISSNPALLLKDKKIYSFIDLRDAPLDKICDPGTCDPIKTNNWVFNDDENLRKKMFELMKLELKDQLYKAFKIKYNAQLDTYYFKKIRGKEERKVSYTSLKGRKSTFTVVKNIGTKKGVNYLRHHAFECSFKKYVDKIYISINPTYYFSSDDLKTDRFHEKKLKKMKEIEKHVSIRNQLLFWENVLALKESNIESKPLLKFGLLKRFKSDIGIEDNRWRNTTTKNSMKEQFNMFD